MPSSTQLTATWAGYVPYGETRGVRGIVEHNRFDLLSLIALVTVIARVYAQPGYQHADPLAIARAHQRCRNEPLALLHLEEQMYALSEQALLELALLYARASRWEEAVVLWERLAARGMIQAIERLAKYYEHTRHDYKMALVYSKALIAHDGENAAHQQRMTRVQIKADRNGRSARDPTGDMSGRHRCAGRSSLAKRERIYGEGEPKARAEIHTVAPSSRDREPI